MNRTRSFLLVKGLLATLVCGSNCFAQGWAPIGAAGSGPATQSPVQPVQAVGQAATLPVNQPTIQSSPLPAVMPAHLLEVSPAPVAPPATQPVVQPAAQPAVPQATQPVVPPAAPPVNQQTWPPEFLERLPHPPDHPTTLLQPATAQQYSCPSPAIPTRYFEADLPIDPAGAAPVGWFSSLEVQAVAPHIYQSVSNFVTAGSRAPDTVDLPNRGLDWTVAPRVEVGYNFPSGFGGIALSYRFMGTSGSASVFGPDGPAPLQSRMDLNVIDLDYVSWVYTPNDLWTMRWRVGGRLAYLYYDSVLNQSLDTAATGSGIIQQRATDKYYGFGPHASVELTRQLGLPGLSLLGRIDAGSIFGRINQGVSETAFDVASPSGVSFGQNLIGSSQTAPMTSLLLGLNWKPAAWQGVEFFAGYQYEYWWNVGRLSLLQTSRGELQLQGITARFQICY
jgi:Legionella pneumophila major outer membrane protein precursor